MIISRDQAFRIVCNIRTPLSAGKENVGTGSFIVKGNNVYLFIYLLTYCISCV